ncbi:MAG TPA: hypothetical protein VLV86_10670 [Vicinamibacterales bacterium]|nr:hypothetical protein [Vicinamibacterales bacterium]
MSAPSPLLEFFKRGEVARDVRLLAAQGGFAPRADEQLGILVHLLDDPDPEIRQTADETLNNIPVAALSAFLARPDISIGLREFFADRGIFPEGDVTIDFDQALIDIADDDDDPDLANESLDRETVTQKLQKMNFTQRLKAAVKGSKEMRMVLVRDTNRMIAAAVMSSPKMTDQEVEGIAGMASVSEDVLRIIANNRAWLKNYKVSLRLVKNPKTPVAISMNLLQRIMERDLVGLSTDRNIPEPLRIAARKKVLANRT